MVKEAPHTDLIDNEEKLKETGQTHRQRRDTRKCNVGEDEFTLRWKLTRSH